ncbi:LPXTG cell wall anchor domain-containing protein [Corynebacterium accolens]|uniref:LPXTG cell wall anchor domain-containing protein n=1 Tax=Corynebacterium accolens TaxID=38284 RepID=UPI00254CA345|nr:LPXTG cell wall anchor domain-containing protein [Corynebacterium accolens]MDK8674981.1 LPXTG cell wall anchor domain-containing protein [Corynebacterium accolens]
MFELNVNPKLTVKSVDKLDFKWSDGKKRELTQAPTVDEHNTITFEFATGELRPGFKSTTPFGADTSLSVDIPVTVNETVKDGEELGVTVATEIDIRPTLDWTYGKWEMRETEDACYRDAEGTLTFKNPGRYGTWMADMWLGTTADHFELNGNPKFTVTGPNGENLTDKVFPSDAYPKRTLNPQAKPTIYTGADGTDLTNYRWLSRYEWKFNEQMSAGDVWIPEGSTIHVKQRVESTKCDFDPSKDHFGVKVESRNAHLFEQDVAKAKLTVDENPDSPEPSEPTEPSDPSEPSETTPNEDGETTVTTTEPETEAPEPEPEEDPEPSSPSSTTSTEVTTTSETPASSTTGTTTKTTTPTCKPSESESPKPSELTPSEGGKTTVPSTEPESEDPDCEPSGSPEPTPSSTTTPTLPQPLLPVPLLPLGKNKDKEPSTTPEKPKSSEPKGTEPQEPGKEQETTHPQNGSQAHAATSTTAPAPAKGDHSQRTTGLANTGASVIGLVIAGIMAIAGGLFLVRRNRNA